MKKSILLLLWCEGISNSVFASQFQCRYNTDVETTSIFGHQLSIQQMPIVRIWGFDGTVWIKLRTLKFENYDIRNQALENCNDYKNSIEVYFSKNKWGVGLDRCSDIYDVVEKGDTLATGSSDHSDHAGTLNGLYLGSKWLAKRVLKSVNLKDDVADAD